MCGLAFAVPGTAVAAFDLTGFDGQVTRNVAGDPYTQAGGHPYEASTEVVFKTAVDETGAIAPLEDPKNVIADLPPGLVGNPTAVPQCSTERFFSGYSGTNCPLDTMVGLSAIDTPLVGVPFSVPLFNLTPPTEDVPATFGFELFGVRVVLDAAVRSGSDYGLRVTARNINQGLQLRSTKIVIWGVPAAQSHDIQRCKQLDHSTSPPSCTGEPESQYGPHSLPGVPRPFMTLPTSCTPARTGLVTHVRADSWQTPGVFDTASFESHLPPGLPAPVDQWGPPQGATGCDLVPFDPSVKAEGISSAPDSPTGLDMGLSFPQDGLLTATGIGTGHLKRAQVTLPDGMTISPGGASGLQACSDAQIGFDNDGAPSCPEASKLGTAVATTPLLEKPLSGEVYVGTQRSDDPESGDMFRMFLSLKGPGVRVKLLGRIRANADTGRLTVTFDDNPQLPVSDVTLSFKSGPRAAVATPSSCGTKTIDADLSSWSGRAVRRATSFDVACTPGLGEFAPALKAGTLGSTAGAFAPFSAGITKPDGNMALNGLTMKLPVGLLAKLKGNIGTEVGSVTAFAGSGSNPFSLPGKVFLEGAYGDAPFSLRVVVPAKAGPFDLGDVVVRQKIYVDPITAQVTVISDPVPTIIKGVPARLQRLDVAIDKPGFVMNPTSCAPKAIDGALGSVAGQTAALSVRFQVADCGSLDVRPDLALSLSGKGETTDGKHPAVTANLTQPFGGQANLKKVRVALPLSLALDPDNANGLCEFVDGSKATPTCPKNSIVGTATAVTPILDEPLSGPVYFVKNVRKDAKTGREIRTLPKLVIPLMGQNGLKLTLTGTSAVEDDQLVTTFDNVPDAPVSSFKLSIIGGKGGILTVSDADICKSTQIAEQEVDGQNNKAADADVFIQTPSCPLKVLSKKVGKSSVAVKVGGLGAGKVIVSGRGIKKTSKTITKSTVATITAKRTEGKPAKVTVSFDPAGPAKARKTNK
jgi:hypothetical protein